MRLIFKLSFIFLIYREEIFVVILSVYIAFLRLLFYNRFTSRKGVKKMNVGHRMKQRRKELRLSADDVAEKIGVNRSTVFRYEKGDIEKLPLEILEPLSEILRTTPQQLMGWDDNPDIIPIYNELERPRQQKVYNLAGRELEEQRYMQNHDDYVGQTAAGAPIEGQQPIPFVGAKTVNLLVNGDSMEPEFYDGDIIKYHPQPELENGEIGVFAVNGGVTLKRFRKNDDIRLESLNKKYEDIVIKETDDFSILGKVII